jgi:hypothetical protein
VYALVASLEDVIDCGRARKDGSAAIVVTTLLPAVHWEIPP